MSDTDNSVKFVNAQDHYKIQNSYIRMCEEDFLNCIKEINEKKVKNFFYNLAGLYEFSYSFIKKITKKYDTFFIKKEDADYCKILEKKLTNGNIEKLFWELVQAKRDIYDALERKRMRLPVNRVDYKKAGKNSVFEVE